MIEIADGSVVTVEQTARFFPNLASLDPETKIQAFREFKPMRDQVEITVFYREPGKTKQRLDAVIEGRFLTEGVVVSATDIKIVSLTEARTAIS